MNPSEPNAPSPTSNLASWKVDQERSVLKTPVMDVIEQDCHASDDPKRLHRFYLLRSRDWCNVAAITENREVVLVRQWRIGIQAHTLETPGGIIDPKDPDPAQAALREMAEETGYTLLPGGKVMNLGWTHPNPAILDNRVHLIVAGPVRLTRSQELDSGEMIETQLVPIDQIADFIEQGKITHALTLNTLHRLMLLSRQGRDVLASALGSFDGRSGGVE
jgi:ADP-ribose pyrophosphatase